jgi:hypothetical protein
MSGVIRGTELDSFIKPLYKNRTSDRIGAFSEKGKIFWEKIKKLAFLGEASKIELMGL